MDVVGGILLADGMEVKALTRIDDHSRFIVCAGLMSRADSRSVCSHFAEALRTYGVPRELLTDSGKAFTGRFGKGKVEVLFDRICRENGIDHLRRSSRSPDAGPPADASTVPADRRRRCPSPLPRSPTAPRSNAADPPRPAPDPRGPSSQRRPAGPFRCSRPPGRQVSCRPRPGRGHDASPCDI